MRSLIIAHSGGSPFFYPLLKNLLRDFFYSLNDPAQLWPAGPSVRADCSRARISARGNNLNPLDSAQRGRFRGARLYTRRLHPLVLPLSFLTISTSSFV